MSITSHLRQSYLDYFRTLNYKLISRSNVSLDDYPQNFVITGIDPFIETFFDEFYDLDDSGNLGNLSNQKRHNKLMNSQICIHIPKKIEDLDQFDCNLTCFEMLDGWILRTNDRTDVINNTFKFLVDHCNIDEKSLWVTYFPGNNTLNLQEDILTFNEWQKYLPNNKILKGNDKYFTYGKHDGLCGPSTTIFYQIPNGKSVQLCRICFVQYNKTKSGYEPFKQHYVDMGMGLEKLAMITQKKQDIYDIDCFRYLFGYAQALSNAVPYQHAQSNHNNDQAYKLFVDHMRTCVIAVHHGVDFGVGDKGNLLRKLYRRMLTYIYIYLNDMHARPIMSRALVSGLISDILNLFVERKHDSQQIQKKLIEEEKSYLLMLRNLPSIDANISKKMVNEEERLRIFKDTYGIYPLIANNYKNLIIDHKDYL